VLSIIVRDQLSSELGDGLGSRQDGPDVRRRSGFPEHADHHHFEGVAAGIGGA